MVYPKYSSIQRACDAGLAQQRAKGEVEDEEEDEDFEKEVDEDIEEAADDSEEEVEEEEEVLPIASHPAGHSCLPCASMQGTIANSTAQ